MVIEGGVYLLVPAMRYCAGRCCGRIKKETQEVALRRLNKQSESKGLETNSKQTEFEIAGDSWKAQFDIPGALVDVMYRQVGHPPTCSLSTVTGKPLFFFFVALVANVYPQGIVWSGMYFSPMIPVMGMIASIWTFFVRKRYLFNHCGTASISMMVPSSSLVADVVVVVCCHAVHCQVDPRKHSEWQSS